MQVIDVATVLEPVSADHPAGPDLQYDSAYLDLMHASEGTPERVMGDTVVPAEPPDWRRIQGECIDLLKRSKDLRVASLLVRALIHTSALRGLADGTQVLQGLVDRFWDSVHPELDASDDNDPTERMNALMSLSDTAAILAPLRDVPLAHSRTFGGVSLRDIEVADGKVRPRSDEEPLDATVISAAFTDADLEELTGNATAVASALDSIRTLSSSLATRVGGADAPSFEPLVKLLTAIDATLTARLKERQPVSAEDAELADDADVGTQVGDGTRGGGLGRINSREDVVRVLDKICDYYRRNEPSSPVPLLLQRARRLAVKDFVDIIRDLVPEAVDKITMIQGPDEGHQSGKTR